MIYYEESELKRLQKKRTIDIVLTVLDALAFVAILVLSLVLSNYHNQRAFQIIAAIGLPLTALPLVLLISLIRFYKKAAKEYAAMLQEKPKSVSGLVLAVADKPISLPNSTRVYSIRVQSADGIRYIYLSALFDCPFENGKFYRFQVVNDFIWGYEE